MKNSSSNSLFKDYYYLTKPGIIRGNALAMIAGFLLAAQGAIDWDLFLAALIGLSLIIASGCVFNNYIDRGIDKKMKRTKDRALVNGRIPTAHALAYGTFLALTGSIVLALGTNQLTLGLALFGLFAYVVLYGIGKRRSTLGTVIGSISGAIPPIVGYCAVANRFDVGALLLFLCLVFWQMPHFFAIAMYRYKDYAAAGLPVLPVKKGMRITKLEIIAYIIAFMIASVLLSVFNYTSVAFAVIMIIICLVWISRGVRGFGVENDEKWARGMFGFSLIVLLVFCAGISLDSIFLA